MIAYVTGDATQVTHRPAVIAHVVNDVGAWGAGFVLALSRRWPQPERVFHEHHRAVGLLLGTCHAVEVEPGLWVANMVAQHGLHRAGGRPPIRYSALRLCLEQAAGMVQRLDASLHMPRIGCGLAGGSWDEVGPIVEDTCSGLPVFVYDLPTQGAL